MTERYLFHTVQTAPRTWRTAADALDAVSDDVLGPHGGRVFGIWRSQIGRPRDEVTAITTWPSDLDEGDAIAAASRWLGGDPQVRAHESRAMTPTLRPTESDPPRRQGNYAFRFFSTPEANFAEFLSLCGAAWPGFEAAYDSQVIGLWQFDKATAQGAIDTLLLTRRPNLAMWERSKLPEGDAEREVRAKLSRRYDLCDATFVVTTTLITADDERDDARWA